MGWRPDQKKDAEHLLIRIQKHKIAAAATDSTVSSSDSKNFSAIVYLISLIKYTVFIYKQFSFFPTDFWLAGTWP